MRLLVLVALVLWCEGKWTVHYDENGHRIVPRLTGRNRTGKPIPVAPAPPVWLSPNGSVAGPLLPPLDHYGASFPRAFAVPGHPFGSRPFLGDDSQLRLALNASRGDPSRVFKILVLGGSPASGEGCVDGRVRADKDAYAWWHDPKSRAGSSSECSWAARLSRYVRFLVPNCLVVNLSLIHISEPTRPY